MNTAIDINADVGEGIGRDSIIMSLISSCNIACGGHAGDREIIRKSIQLAKNHGLRIGAHPSYPDKEGFGRRPSALTDSELLNSLTDQLSIFRELVDQEKATWHHVKPHGQLYHDLMSDDSKADVFVQALKKSSAPMVIYHAPKSILQNYSEIMLLIEDFIDRRYNVDGFLLSRSGKNAVIHNPDKAAEQLFNLINTRDADTYCIHGDNPFAINILEYLHEALPAHNIQII